MKPLDLQNLSDEMYSASSSKVNNSYGTMQFKKSEKSETSEQLFKSHDLLALVEDLPELLLLERDWLNKIKMVLDHDRQLCLS